MLTAKIKAALAASALVVAFGAGWLGNGWRLGQEIAKIELSAAKDELAKSRGASKDLIELHGGFLDALQQFQDTQYRNGLAQQSLETQLRDFGALTGGLRADFADMPRRIERASQSTLAGYAATCTAVFEDVAREVRALAEDGAAIARAADGHAADVKLIQDAKPKPVQ